MRSACREPSPASPFALAGADVVVAVSVADVRREPDDTAERVTQALLGTAARTAETHGGWTYVTLPDYEGWVHGGQLAPPTAPSAQRAVVAVPRAQLALAGGGVSEVYVTTELPLLEMTGQTARVALPGGREGTLDASHVVTRPAGDPPPARGVQAALDLARRLLGVPYLWGGTTPLGCDCSGLAQLCYRWAGCVLRRDAHQQYESIPYAVERGDLRAGDLAFFARDGAIVHVGLMLDAVRMLHADGSVQHQVTINALDPAAPDFAPRLAHLYAGARRPIP